MSSDARLPQSILIITQNYLGDTITFRPDDRFINQTLLSTQVQFQEAARDLSQHVLVTRANNNAIYRVGLNTPIYDRFKFNKIIDKTFSEL